MSFYPPCLYFQKFIRSEPLAVSSYLHIVGHRQRQLALLWLLLWYGSSFDLSPPRLGLEHPCFSFIYTSRLCLL
jgi:hypothetical protein